MVSGLATLASSSSSVAQTRVSMIWVRPAVRSTARPDSNPTTAAAAMPTNRPEIGSGDTCMAYRPAA